MIDALDHLARRRVRHERQALLDDGRRGRQVPVEGAVERGMIEPVQRAVDRGHGAPDIPQQRIALTHRVAEGTAGEPRDEADEVRAVLRDVRAVARGDGDGREAGARQAVHDRVLRVEHLPALGRVGDLEDEPAAVLRRQVKVLIALARKRRGGGGDSEHVPRQTLGVVEREPGRVREGHDGAFGQRPPASRSFLIVSANARWPTAGS
jgi:hypothetical protein